MVLVGWLRRLVISVEQEEIAVRIMFTIPTLGTGGAERVASILANYFSKTNEVEFFVFEQSNVERYHIDKCVAIKQANVAVKRGNKLRVIMNYVTSFAKQRKALREEIIRFKPDVVISFLPKADMLTYTVAKKIDFVWIPSERNDPMARSKAERSILNFIYRSANVLVCQTKRVSEYYESHGVKKTSVIRNPLILKETPNVPVDVDESYFVSVGRLDKQKNFEMLINAFADAVRKCKCTDKLLILGEGPEHEKLNEQIKALGMMEAIILIGRTNDVNTYLKGAKAFILSSDYEGLPNAMLEAMAMGLPIISTDFFTGAARELVSKENGIIISVNNRQEMTFAIETMIHKSTDELHAMGLHSRNRVNSLSVENISSEWTELVRKEVENG